MINEIGREVHPVFVNESGRHWFTALNAYRHFRDRVPNTGRVWVNCYHVYPAGASFGGYKNSGIGRENHAMMLNGYRHTKNVLISYNKNKLGFF